MLIRVNNPEKPVKKNLTMKEVLSSPGVLGTIWGRTDSTVHDRLIIGMEPRTGASKAIVLRSDSMYVISDGDNAWLNETKWEKWEGTITLTA